MKLNFFIIILLAISIDGVTITSNSYLKIPNSNISEEFKSNLMSIMTLRSLKKCISQCQSMGQSCNVVEYVSSMANNCQLYSISNPTKQDNLTLSYNSSIVVIKNLQTETTTITTTTSTTIIPTITTTAATVTIPFGINCTQNSECVGQGLQCFNGSCLCAVNNT